MNCNEALELLSAALDGELSPAQQAQLDQHLALCPTCRALQAELLGLEEALGTLDVPAPAGLKDQIMKNLPPQQGKGHVVYWRRWSAMAAAAALVLLGVWKLPRFVLTPDKGVDSTEMAAYDAPAMDAAVQAPQGSEAAPTALNDEAPVPPYVEDNGVNVNAASAPEPDPDGADYIGYGSSYVSEPADTPQAMSAPIAAAAPKSSTHKLYTSPATGSDTAQTGGGLSEGSATDQAAAEAGGENVDRAPALMTRSYSPTENGMDPLAPEATPEVAMFTATRAPLEPEPPAENAPESSEEAPIPSEVPTPMDALVKTVDPFASYCGVLTLEQYEPGDQEFTVEFSEDGLRQYILSTGDFQALVEQLDDQGLPYELTTEGEGIDPEALCGLVVVEEQPPEAAVETP